MNWRGPLGRLVMLVLVAAGLAACGPGYIRGTQVLATEENQQLADLVERYRIALIQRDTDALRMMVSTRYYENASTTSDPTDDYDVNGLDKVLDKLKNQVKAVKCDIEISDIQVLGDHAHIDYDYTTQYLYTTGEQDRWDTASDTNRLTFLLESGKWRILSGL